ncbi:MAG: MotE family protein [Planctomycetota bacterium]|jgi:flagellar motility protein MotE (MotC chaperone)
MRNAMIAVGIILLGSALFLGSTVMILGVQGRLEGEDLRNLKENPVLGSFLPEPEPKPEPDPDQGETGADGAPANPRQEETSGWRSVTGGGETDGAEGEVRPLYTETARIFSTEELQDMLDSIQQSKAQCEREWAAIEMEKLDLARLGEDLTERKREIEKTMGDVALAKADLDAAREMFRKEVLTIEDAEDKMIRKLAEVYENMKPPEKAAEHFDEMDLDQAVKIMVRMDSAKAAKIFPYMSAGRVKDLTEKLSRFQEKAKEEKAK